MVTAFGVMVRSAPVISNGIVAVGDGSLADGIGAYCIACTRVSEPLNTSAAFQSGGYIGQGRIGSAVYFAFGIGYDGHCFRRDGQVGTGIGNGIVAVSDSSLADGIGAYCIAGNPV